MVELTCTGSPQLDEMYQIKRCDEVRAYLTEHPDVAALLAVLRTRIAEYFPDEAVTLDVMCGSPFNNKELVVSIITYR
ncbi:MAG: hypothetical protein N3G75_09250, partial [Methanothrix sp.]